MSVAGTALINLLADYPFQYLTALIGTLGSGSPGALARMRQVVGRRRARIGLDDDAVDIAFGPHGLIVEPAAPGASVDGQGETDTGTVLALLDGYLEVSDAILGGRLRVSGAPEAVVRMFAAIEILLDASPRTPGLQALADKFAPSRGRDVVTDRLAATRHGTPSPVRRTSGRCSPAWICFRTVPAEARVVASDGGTAEDEPPVGPEARNVAGLHCVPLS